MFHWIEGHGMEAMAIWAVLLIIAGTMPPVSSDASYGAKWIYAIMKMVSLNGRGISNAMGIKLPELKLEKTVETVSTTTSPDTVTETTTTSSTQHVKTVPDPKE